ncbi:MAG: DUF1254 domain-containing protein [Candidatus Nitrosopolaris sp.]
MSNNVEGHSRSKIIRDAIILFSLASLCFSGSFSALQFLPAVNAANPSPPTTSASAQSPIEQLNTKMAQISSSNNPADIATLAYIWGFPLVTMQRQFNFVTSPDVPPGVGRGPANTLSCARNLVNASSTDVVSPNSDTIYCFVQFDLKKEPVVLVAPAVPADRYHTFEFLDAYTNVFSYLGTRSTGSNGGTYLIAGPDWKGKVPQGMTKIWSPTNLAWLINHILVKSPSDLANVLALQDKISVKPLSVFQGKTVAANTQQPSTLTANVSSSSSKQVPIGPQPYLIAPTGIKIYDEIGKAMIGNPLNPPDPVLVTKMASIGIGPGKTPSVEANDTIKAALQTGIVEGQKMIDARVANIGELVNGWLIAPAAGVFGTDYLLRAATTQVALGSHIAQEALYPLTFTDKEGKPLTGANNYTIHFNAPPPVNAFWSITMYNNKSLFVDNPINRYKIGKYTEGLKNNTDGSVDIYIQHATPGADKESNWLPAPATSVSNTFNLVIRTYLPGEQVLNGTWTPPPVMRTG